MTAHRRWGGPVGGGGGGSFTAMGFSMPAPVGWLIALTVAATAVGALFQRNGLPVHTYAVLVIDWVFGGELWRLVTWVLVESGGGGLNLLFGCLLLYFVGGDLWRRWGTARFYATYFGVAAATAVITCLIGRFVWSDVARVPYFAGMWPVIDALLIAWAVLYPDRRILVYFILPLSSRQLVAFTIGATVLMALINGLALFIPHLTAELLMLLYMDVVSVRRLYLRARMSMLQRDYKRRTAHLRMVEREDEKPPRWMH